MSEALEINRVTERERVVTAIAIAVPFLALLYVISPLGGGFDVVAFSLFLGFYLLRGFGITVGYHRYFTHRSFRVRHPAVEYMLGICGSMAMQGGLFAWVTHHLEHHRHTDTPGDPHSPHMHGGSIIEIIKGAYHSHIGWMFEAGSLEIPEKIRNNIVYARIDRWFGPSLILGFILPPLLGAMVRGSFEHVVMDFVWGVPVCIFFTQHVTWCVNSVCHIWGSRPFKTGDESANNVLIAILGLGEGFHNGHHAFERSAKQGVLPGQIDLSWYVIKGMEKLGLVYDVNVPTSAQIESKLK